MNAIPLTARPEKMCQFRSLKRFDDQPMTIVATVANAYRIAEMRATLQTCHFCTGKPQSASQAKVQSKKTQKSVAMLSKEITIA